MNICAFSYTLSKMCIQIVFLIFFHTSRYLEVKQEDGVRRGLLISWNWALSAVWVTKTKAGHTRFESWPAQQEPRFKEEV